MDRCLKDKAHFIIAQTIWNNKNGKAVFAEQVFDRCQRKFQDEINRELYKLIEEGGGGSAGKDGKTPVLKAGEITSLPYGAEPTFKLVYEGNNHEGNPVYRMDLGLPQGKPGEDGNDGNDGDDGISPTLRLTEQGIEVSYDKGSTWSLLVPISEFHITNNITNEYINNPDEEDITVIDDKLKFKDKEYNLSKFSGLGRTYLRKNIIGSKNVLTYDMFNSSSTIYHIQYNYDLDGKTIVIPSDSILLFEGGSFYNGTIVGNHTTILSNNKCFESITIVGTINGYVYSSWWQYSESDDAGQTELLKSIVNINADYIRIDSNFNVINPHIELNGASDKILDYEGSFIKVNKSDYSSSASVSYAVLKLGNCSNIVIKNMREQGDVLEHYEDGTTFTGNKLCKGIEIYDNCSNITIENCTCNYNIGDGIEIVSTNNTGIYIKDILVKDCVCDYNRRQGYSVEAGNNIILNNCLARYTGKYLKENACGFDVEPWANNNVPQKITLVNCVAEYSENFDFMFSSSVANHEGEDIQLTGCTFEKISIYNAKNLNVYRSTIYKNFKVYGDTYYDNPVRVQQCNIGRVYLQQITNTDFTQCNIFNTDTTSAIATIGIYGDITTTTSFKQCYISNTENAQRMLLRSSNTNFDNVTVNFEDCVFDENSNYVDTDVNLFIYFSKVKIHNCIFNIKHKLRFYGCLEIDCSNNKFYNKGEATSLILIDGQDYADREKIVDISFVNNYFENSQYLYTIKHTIDVDDILKIVQLINTSLDNLYELDTCKGRAVIITKDTACSIKNNTVTYDIAILNDYNKQMGVSYFNTVIGKPVWWNGTTWITYPDSGGEGGGADGKTPVMQIGNVTTVDAGEAATANVRQDGTDVSGNPIYKIDFGIPRGANGDDGYNGKTPVFETGTITTLEPNQPGTCTITKTGDDPQGNPIYKVDVGIPKGDTGAPGATPSLDGYATEKWVTTRITNTVGIINASLDNINGEIV